MKTKLFSVHNKSLLYKLFGHGNTLFILFPRAAATYDSHSKLIQKLVPFGTVLFLESGYFGIHNPTSESSESSVHEFSTLLHALTKKLGKNNVVVIGESVGGIHALTYAHAYPKETKHIILSNPAFYTRKIMHSLLFIPMLKLGLRTSPDAFLKFLATSLKISPSTSLKKVGNAFLLIQETVSARSYLTCLKEIADFSKTYQLPEYTDVIKRSIILRGKDDKIFDVLCNTPFCKQHAQYKEVSYIGHGIIDEKPEEVLKALYTFLPKNS